jgi:hypothetical protein
LTDDDDDDDDDEMMMMMTEKFEVSEELLRITQKSSRTA